jgi:peptidoglycan/LPS O-acetylase OafA/YrhL
MKSSVKHVEFLDHFRGIAILGVLLCHSLGEVYGYGYVPWKGWFRDFSDVPFSSICLFPLSFGQAGVAIFFVVSGFCIHMSFQKQGQRWGSFFLRRIFRIYPAYLAALIFFILLVSMKHFRLIFQHQDVWKQIGTHLFFIHNFDPSTFKAINPPLWSLAVEAQLYLLYPALLVVIAKIGWRRTMVLLAGCELLIQGTDGWMQTSGAPNSVGGHISWLFANSPLGYWFSWSLGAFIADAFLKKQPLPFLKTSPAWWLALAIMAYFIKPLSSFSFLLSAVVTAVVASRLLSGARPKIKVPALSLDILKKIGLWSYSIYLLYYPLLDICSYAIQGVVPMEYRSYPPAAFLLVVVTWLAIIPFSILWYKLFELPGIALGKRIIKKMDVGDGAKIEPERFHGNGQARMVGRYGLMIGILLALVVGSFLASAKFTPPEPEENNNLAWSLATSPEAANRNGARAVKLAEDACQRTQHKQTIMVGTLAAAYAEAGRFDEAILTAQQACALAAKNGETNLLQKNQELLELYQNHQPYRDRQANTRK